MKSFSPQDVPAILQEAQWIWPDSSRWDLSNCYALFRKTFFLKSIPREAPLFITADQSYQLSVNGRYVCRGPARGFQKSWPYDEIDLREYLNKGENVLAIRAFNPGHSNFQYIHEGSAGLLAGARWGNFHLVTDLTWKCRRQKGINRNTTPTSLQLFPQEDIDLRVEDPAWVLPDYQEGEDWTPHELASAVWNGLPWSSLEERGIPMLDESIILPASCIGRAKGKSSPIWQTDRNLAINRFTEGLAHESLEVPAETLAFPPSGKGNWRSYLIDFGKVVVGSVVLKIEGARGGEAVETFHAETIDSERLEPHFLPEAHCRMAFAQRLTCRVGAQEHPFYHPFGFRYMVLTVRGNTTPLRVSTSLRATVYPHALRGSFQSSNALLERIWETCAWTERICSMDAYVDTPWREQAQWWGDARVQAWNTFHLSGDARLFQRGIRQIGAQTTPDGVTYGHAPTIAHNCVLPDFTLIWMATLWDDYWQTGSPASFISQRKIVEGALAYFKKWTDAKTGLLKYDNRYWLFLDWTEIQREGSSTLYNSWLLYALDRVAALYAIVGEPQAATRCKRWAGQLRKALLRLAGADGLLCDGILPGGKANKHCSVHAQTMALMNRLAPRQERTFLKRSLLPFLRGELRTKTEPSAYWITYVYTELALRGHGAEVIADIEKRWTPMAEFGSTFEGFHCELGNWSRSHAWSAHPLFHLMQTLGGVRQTAPAWKEISYSPVFEGDSAAVTIPTPQGDILSEWKRLDAGRAEATLTLPKGMRASVKLPGIRKPLAEGTGPHRFDIKL